MYSSGQGELYLWLPAVLLLTTLGYQNARSVSGGTSAWQQMGYATESG